MSDPRPETIHRATLPGDARRCRASGRWRRCDEPVVAELMRSNGWWAYCANHLADYDREVRDGVVRWRGSR